MPAYDRLPRAQQRNLRSIAASMAMEDMAPSAEQLEILALHMLGEIDAAERTRRLDALLRRSLKTNRSSTCQESSTSRRNAPLLPPTRRRRTSPRLRHRALVPASAARRSVRAGSRPIVTSV